MRFAKARAEIAQHKGGAGEAEAYTILGAKEAQPIIT